MRFLLSIHDVWPGNLQLVTEYLARLRSLGAEKMALLVVPAYHGQPTMDKSPEFVKWLKAESEKGTELFLHGYHHQTREAIYSQHDAGRRNAWGKWVNRNLVSQEAEFCGLSRPDQERLLELGLTTWSQVGLPMTGFVAPTWHGSPSLGVLRDKGIGLSETRFYVKRLSDGKSRFAPPLAWAFSKSQNKVKLVGGEIWLRLLLQMPLIKVVLHPGDFAAVETETILQRVFTAGSPMRYADLFTNVKPQAITDSARQ